MTNDIDLSNIDLGELTQVLANKLDQEAAEYNELADAYETLNDQYVNVALKNSLLEQQLAEKSKQLISLESSGTNIEAERLKLKGQLATTRKQLKELQGLGDPARLKKKNQELRDTSEERKNIIKDQQKRIASLKVELGKAQKMLQGQGDKPIYSNDNNEVVYLHNERLRTRFEKHTREVIMLKYWHPHGIGRLVSWDGERLTLSEGGMSDLDSYIPMSQDVVDFCIGWFTEHVIVKGDSQHYIDNRKTA